VIGACLKHEKTLLTADTRRWNETPVCYQPPINASALQD